MLKRFLSLLLISFSLGLGSASVSAPADAGLEAAIAAAMGAMDDFMLGFNARDPEAWAASLNYPHVRFASGTVTVWETAEEFAKTRAFENLPRRARPVTCAVAIAPSTSRNNCLERVSESFAPASDAARNRDRIRISTRSTASFVKAWVETLNRTHMTKLHRKILINPMNMQGF